MKEGLSFSVSSGYSPVRKEKGDSDKAMEVQSNENAALLKLLKTKSRTKTELLKVSSRLALSLADRGKPDDFSRD